MHDPTDSTASRKVPNFVKLPMQSASAIDLHSRLVGFLTWDMIKDKRLRGRARSEARDTVSRGWGTLNIFACIAMLSVTTCRPLLKKALQEIVVETCPC
jgi:hypothetical protein